MQQQQQMPQTQDIRIKPKDLTDAEIAQILQSRKIQPDIQGRALKSEAIVQEKRIEQGKMKTEGYKNLADIVNSLDEPKEPKTPKGG